MFHSQCYLVATVIHVQFIRSQICVCIYTYICIYIYICIKVKVKFSRYRPSVAQRVGRGIALLFHDRGTRRRWVISTTPRPHFTSGKDTVPILQEAVWAPGPVWTGGKSRRCRTVVSSYTDWATRPTCIYTHTHTHTNTHILHNIETLVGQKK